jgi:hypothetical protein
MRADKFVKVLLRLLNIRKNNIVSRKDNFLGGHERHIRRWMSEVNLLPVQGAHHEFIHALSRSTIHAGMLAKESRAAIVPNDDCGIGKRK